MLTPEYLQGLPAELEKLYLKLEEDMISDICRRIKLAGRLTDTAEYQVLRMKELGAGTEYIKRKIAEYSQLSDDAVDRMFFDAAQVSDDFYREAYSKANKDYVPFEYNDYFQQIVTANINQTNGELRNFTRSMGFSYRGSNGVRRFHDTAETYRDCLDYAFTQAETGAVDYITAVRNAARRLTESGLQFVDYSSGVVNHADVAVRRAVLTGISQVTGKIAEHNAAELDTDIVEVTAHAGARPDHAEWQGGWYSLSGKSKKYRSLAEATGYGRVDGLKGANCRHDFYPVIEGVDKPMYTAEELANIDPPPFTDKNGKTYTYYEATQRQRAMERAIRKTKREILAADSSGDSDMFTAKSVLLRRQREEYNRFSNAAGLLTQNERNQVIGFGRSVASRAAWADRKATASSSSGGSGNSNGLGGHAVEVSVSGSDNGGNGKLYRDTGLTSDGGNGQSVTSKVTQTENEASTSLTKAENGDKLKTVPGNTPKNNSTSKSQHGRGARTSNASNLKDSHVHKIGNIDFNDKKAVTEYMEKFENKFAHKDKEYCLVITPNGEIYVARGGAAEIDTDKIFGDKMNGSWNTHTHPPDQTEYSFSTRDVSGAVLDGTAVMRASDTKYCYEIRFNGKTFTEDELADIIGTAEILKYDSFDAKGYTMADYVDKYEHSVIEDICEMLGVEYKRWEKS